MDGRNATSDTQPSEPVESVEYFISLVDTTPIPTVVRTPPALEVSTQVPQPSLVPDQNVAAPEDATTSQLPPLPSGSLKRARTGITSSVWDQYSKIKLANGDTCKDFSKCNHCGDKVPSNVRRNGTSSLWNHGTSCKLSPLHVKEDPKQKTINKDNVTGGIVLHVFNQKNCDKKLFEMVVRDELPFRFVEGGGFKEFVYELQPRYKLPGRKAVARGILARYQLEKAKLFTQFAMNDTRISITTDCWTSIQNINYMVVTSHFMDSDWKLHKRIINFCVITSHKGDDIGRLLEQCLRGWGITKVFTITADNASANEVAVGYMKKRLRSYKTLMFGGEFLHVRCVCHIINLIVKDGIKELQSGIEKIWNCVKYVRSSAARLAKFREFSVVENMNANANVPLDVVTRWNSTYLILKVALGYETVFTRMSEEDQPFNSYFEEVDRSGNKREGPPEDEDWRKAAAFVQFLEKFYVATVKLSAWKSVTANIVFAEMVELQCEIDKGMNAADPIMREVAISMKAKFNKYWGSFEKLNKIVLIAHVLDPRFKLHGACMGFEVVGYSPEVIESIGWELKQTLMRMFEVYRGEQVQSRQPGIGGTEANVVQQENEDGQCRILRALKERLGEHNQSVNNEVDLYLSDQMLVVRGYFDVAGWWKQNSFRYPLLAKIAKDVMTIPCSTVASENAFSLGSRIVDPFRASLTPKMVEALVCSSDWLRGEEVNFFKEATEEELELYLACEQIEQEDVERPASTSNSTNPVTPCSTPPTPSSTPPNQVEQVASASVARESEYAGC